MPPEWVAGSAEPEDLLARYQIPRPVVIFLGVHAGPEKRTKVVVVPLEGRQLAEVKGRGKVPSALVEGHMNALWRQHLTELRCCVIGLI